MPNWSPNWHDVEFDHNAAQDYIDAGLALVTKLEAWLTAREKAAQDARKEWKGPHRLHFDKELARQHREAVDIIEDLHYSMKTVRDAMAFAAMEQRRRMDDRSRWTMENEAEIRLREQLEREELVREGQRRQAEEAARSATAAPGTTAAAPPRKAA